MIKPRAQKRNQRFSGSKLRSGLFDKITATVGEYDRIALIMMGVVVLTALIVGRLFDLQVLQHPFYEALAQDQHIIWKELQPERGEIFVYDYHGNPEQEPEKYPIATNKELTHIFAIPKRMSEPEESAEQLAALLGLDEEVLLERFSKNNDLYEPIEHGVPEELVEKVKELEIEGVGYAPEQGRHYSKAESAAQITGFVGFIDDEARGGQYGIEQQFDTELAGELGSLRAERSAGGQIIGIGDRIIEPAKDGVDVVLTIERSVQYKACAELQTAIETYDAAGGEVVVMEPSTGRILAMCNYPTFDANNYGNVEDISVYNNRAVASTYEPGSVFKPLTMAAALDQGVVSPDTTFVDPVIERIAGYEIRNFEDRDYGTQTMTGCLENSVNTCLIHVMRTVTPKKFYDYLVDFGFEQQTGIDLPGEAYGDLGELQSGKEIFGATASFGQGITTTVLQLTSAYGAIANGGKLMKPQIVDAFVHPNGFVREVDPEIVRQPITAKTSKTLSAMLASVVENGHAKRAAVPGYYVGGKTGTAQIASDGGYDPNKTNHTFVGFFPIADPQIVMAVRLERPSAGRVSSVTATPTFGRIAKFLADYYRIPQDKE